MMGHNCIYFMLITILLWQWTIPLELAAASDGTLLQAVFSGELDKWWDNKVEDIRNHTPDWLNKGTENLPSPVAPGAARGTRGGIFVSNNVDTLTSGFVDSISNFSSEEAAPSRWNYQQFKGEASREVTKNILDAVPFGDVVVKVQDTGGKITNRISDFVDRVKEGAEQFREFLGENGENRDALDISANDKLSFESTSNVLKENPLPNTYYGQLVHVSAEEESIPDSQYAYKNPEKDPYYSQRYQIYRRTNLEDSEWVEMQQINSARQKQWREIPKWKPDPKEVTAWNYGTEMPEICWEGVAGMHCEETPRIDEPTAKMDNQGMPQQSGVPSLEQDDFNQLPSLFMQQLQSLQQNMFLQQGSSGDGQKCSAVQQHIGELDRWLTETDQKRQQYLGSQRNAIDDVRNTRRQNADWYNQNCR